MSYPPQGPPGPYPNNQYPPLPQGYDPPARVYGPPRQEYGPLPQGYVPPPQCYGPPPLDYPHQPPQGGYTPVINQPVGQGGMSNNGWMKMPRRPVNCPPGLEYLTTIDQLLVDQKIHLLEVFTGYIMKNKYVIKNNLGQKMYYAVEDSDCLSRNCAGLYRSFDIKIFDNFRNEVIHLYRPLACDSCCCPCCLQVMEISAPPGNIIGRVEQEWSIFYPCFAIKNANGVTVLRIEGPFCVMNICGRDVEFKVMSSDGTTQVGKISKQWSGLIREIFTDADIFGITFPMDLDVRMKAVMLGACFLFDAMFFEESSE